jgi:hypothetical protein
MLVRLLYASRTTPALAERGIDDLLRQSRRNNISCGITGMLCLSNGVFVQVIEGGRADVSRLFARIIADPRNTDVQILMFEDISERRFGNWTMGQVNIASVNPALLLKYSARPSLDPYTAGGAATMKLLVEMAESGAIAQRE